MTTSRRKFLEEIIAAGLLAGAIPTAAAAHTTAESLLENSYSGEFNPQTDHDAHAFWNNFFDSIGPNRGARPLEAHDRKVEYLHHNESMGLRYLSDLKPNELLDFDGDVTVTATLGQFRPGTEDRQILENVKASSLRVDFVQTQSFMNVLAPMAWAAMAVFAHDKANKLPTVGQLGYQKNFMDGKILLPGGTGKFALNVFPVKPESTLHKILKIVIPAVMAAAPVLNFPAISIPVLKTITQLYLGPKEEESYGKPLLNSLPVRWSATQQAFAEALEVEKFPLVDGDYIMIPQAHADELSKSFSTLDLKQGYLVARDASKSDSPDSRALQAVPDVTYVTMRLKVAKVPLGGLPKAVGNETEAEPVSNDQKGSQSAPPKSGSPPKKKP